LSFALGGMVMVGWVVWDLSEEGVRRRVKLVVLELNFGSDRDIRAWGRYLSHIYIQEKGLNYEKGMY